MPLRLLPPGYIRGLSWRDTPKPPPLLTKSGFPTSDIVYAETVFTLQLLTLTKITVMNAALAVRKSHVDVQTSRQRLSTGSSINAARDDAAEWVVSS